MIKRCELNICKRIAMDLTQAELAEKVGCSGYTISAYERGEEVSELINRCVNYTIATLEHAMPREEYLEYKLHSDILALKKESDANEKMHDLAYLVREVGNLQIELSNDIRYAEEPREI